MMLFTLVYSTPDSVVTYIMVPNAMDIYFIIVPDQNLNQKLPNTPKTTLVLHAYFLY